MTTNNCPTDFDIATANVTMDTSIKPLVDLIYGGIFSANEQTMIQSAITTGKTGTLMNYATSIQIMLPFVIIGALFAITFISALCCCVFEKQCPPCQSLKRDFTRRPYEKN